METDRIKYLEDALASALARESNWMGEAQTWRREAERLRSLYESTTAAVADDEADVEKAERRMAARRAETPRNGQPSGS